MRALDAVAQSLKLGSLHPTAVLNTLIAAENEGGLGAVRQLERQLTRSTDALNAREHPHRGLAQIWLGATRAYLVAQAELKRAV
ncbi:hypothetical protein [Deinococcus sp.]|uniref:hypothetical protein n=1 Tax=Deinococcus sp. TaxID=47478 RepID=UPI0025D32EB8|nr:hypothetical protein [Deinococcus sp.]